MEMFGANLESYHPEDIFAILGLGKLVSSNVKITGDSKQVSKRLPRNKKLYNGKKEE